MLSKWIRNVYLVGIAAVVSVSAAWAQPHTERANKTYGAADEITAQISDDARWVTLENKYITFVLGLSGTVTVQNIEYEITGRWHTRNGEGDPETIDDDDFPTVYSILDALGFPQSVSLIPTGLPTSEHGTIKIKIDNNPSVIIDNKYGHWSKVPRLYNPPAPGKGLGKTGPFIEGEWTVDGVGTTNIKLKLHISLVRDTVRFEFTLMNGGAVGQVPRVGLGLFGDLENNFDSNVGTPFVPGIGVATTSDTQYWFPRVFSSAEMPETVRYMDSVETPVIGLRNTLTSQDCTTPDYFTYGEWGLVMFDDVWLPDDYRPQDNWPPVEGYDLAFLAVWKQIGLSAGSSRKIVTYWGADAASVSWTRRSSSRVTPDSALLAVQGPKAIKYDSSNLPSSYSDPLYPTTGALSNPAFKIKAYVYNLNVDPGLYYVLNNVQFYLYLPPGLALNGSYASQEIATVPANRESAPVTWDVVADGSRSGELEYYVSARADSGWQQIVRRKIFVPAIKNNGVFKYGAYQMVSVPFGADNSSIGRMFQWADPGVQMYSKYWDPTGYGSYKDVSNLTPGQGFWAFVSKSATVANSPAYFSLPIDSYILGESSKRQDQEISIDLKQQWNMIGDPFVYPIYLGQLYVHEKTTDDTLTFDDALAKNWISRTIFTWNADKKTYDYLRTNDQMIYPWKGYWIYARVPVKLFFRPATFPGTSVTSQLGGE